MAGKMTIWGIGGKLALFTVLYALALGVLDRWLWPLFAMSQLPSPLRYGIAALLLLIGLPLWVASARRIVKGFRQGELLTEGLYAWFRHPLYASFIVFTIPAVAFLYGSWLFLTVPLVMYFVFRLLIHEEEQYLEREFGDEYRDYKARTNAVFPTFGALKRRPAPPKRTETTPATDAAKTPLHTKRTETTPKRTETLPAVDTSKQ